MYLKNNNKSFAFDVLIVGGGLAGISCAIELANKNKTIAIITKSDFNNSSSYYAQGGIAAVMDGEDSFSNHIQDTLVAGCELCDETVVKHIIENAPSAINWLISLGVDFTKDETTTNLHLTKEGGHSHRRVVHSADATGREVMRALQVKFNTLDGIQVFSKALAVDILKENGECVGVSAFDIENGLLQNIYAKNVILATGGVGQVFEYTTNPPIATGDGIAIAARAGAKIKNMEFIQFHPTALKLKKTDQIFLISEALRGEGALLRNNIGERFMHKYDSRLELAPRDIVARSIYQEMTASKHDCVYLDITHKGKEFIEHHFPFIYEHCLSLGLDISCDYIPVVPAEHYSCGGVATNLSGQTSITNLYAAGECAYTGLHGANRLASNSLLECVVIARGICVDILEKANTAVSRDSLLGLTVKYPTSELTELVLNKRHELQKLMSSYVGVYRSNQGLELVLNKVEALELDFFELKKDYVSLRILELSNLIEVAKIIIKSAKQQTKNVGLHYNVDYNN